MRGHALDRFLFRLASFLGACIARNRDKPWCKNVYRYADQFHRRADNFDFDMDSNGEMRVIRLAEALKPSTVFDIGANIGQWSGRFARTHPSSLIHAFEPIPSTFAKLQENMAQFPNIRLINLGLSNRHENVTLHFTQDIAFDSAATAYPIHGMAFHDRYYTDSIDCDFERGGRTICKCRASIPSTS